MTIIDPIAKFLGEWSANLNVWSILLRLLLSLVLASVIGFERSSKRHAAGLRTFILVALSASVAVIVDEFWATTFDFKVPVLTAATVIGAAIISSNSILFSSKNQIKGLTTSVGLWMIGFLGLAFGAGFYTLGLIAFVLLIFSLSVFPTFEVYLKNRSNHFEVHVEFKDKSNLREFTTTMRMLGLRIDDIEANPAYVNSGLSVYTVAFTVESKELKKYKTHKEIIEAIKSIEYVNYIEELS